MPLFKYTAKDANGNTVSDAIESRSQRTVIDCLRTKGLIILNIEEKQAEARGVFSFLFQKKVKLEDLVIFARQLSTMVDAGVPLLNAFSILAEQTESRNLQEVLAKVRGDIETGSSFSDSVKKYPIVFSDLFINMVRAGESSGTLDEILDRLATYYEKTNRLIKKVKAALVYPVVVIIMAIAITALLLLKVVPVFEDIFADFGSELPVPTQILVTVSNLLREYFFIDLVIFALAVFLAGRYIKTEKGRLAFDRLRLKLPIVGKLIRKIAVSKFTRTLSTLTKSGVPILTALEIVEKTTGNKVIEVAMSDVRDSIKEGERIAEPLSRSRVFPPMVVRMIAIGEETGELEKMLAKISDFYDEQVETAVSGLTSMIEPLLIAFLGIVVGSIIICMFLPIFRLTSIIQV